MYDYPHVEGLKNLLRSKYALCDVSGSHLQLISHALTGSTEKLLQLCENEDTSSPRFAKQL